MSFTRNTLSTTSIGQGSSSPKHFSYSTSDTKAEVKADGYFDNILTVLKNGDFIYCSCSDGVIKLDIEVSNNTVCSNGLQSSAVEINRSTLGERSVPSGFDVTKLPVFRVWRDLNKTSFKTNIKAERLFEDIHADAIVYVDIATGNDTTGDGTISNPYATIYKGVRTKPFNPSNGGKLTVYIKAGIYNGANAFNATGVYADEINIIGYGGLVYANHEVDTTYGYQAFENTKHYCENIIFSGGKSPFNCFNQPGVSNAKMMFKQCGFNNSVSENGINVKRNGIYIFEDCVAKNNHLDGFNYHNQDASKSQIVVEINCKGFSNGKIGGGGNANNGSTMHDEGRIIRINGEYYDNENRNIHDVENCHSWNLGTTASNGQESGQGNFVAGIGDTDTTKMWLDSCTSSGTSNKDIDIYNGTASATAEICTYNSDFSGGIASTVTPNPYEYND